MTEMPIKDLIRRHLIILDDLLKGVEKGNASSICTDNLHFGKQQAQLDDLRMDRVLVLDIQAVRVLTLILRKMREQGYLLLRKGPMNLLLLCRLASSLGIIKENCIWYFAGARGSGSCSYVCTARRWICVAS